MPNIRKRSFQIPAFTNKKVNSNIFNTISKKIFFDPVLKQVQNVTVLKYIFIHYENYFFDGKIFTIHKENISCKQPHRLIGMNIDNV
jgi:hypothetical protein